jgi:hypothetical protein
VKPESRKIRWGKHFVRMGDRSNAHAFWLGNPGERNYFEDPVIEGLDIKMDPKEIKWEGVG